MSIVKGNVISTGVSKELDELRGLLNDGKGGLDKMLERESKKTQIPSLKISFNNVFGYYIEVSNSNLGAVPDYYHRRQTLAGGERFTTLELQEQEHRILQAKEQQLGQEELLFQQLCDKIMEMRDGLQHAFLAISHIDVYSSLAELAARYNYVQPQVSTNDLIEIKGGRHPVVEQMMHDRPFVPNDVSLSSKNVQIAVLTGPNMAGKSTYLRQVALTVILAQMGSFVPALSANIGVIDRIFTRLGAIDDIASGHSTFLVEMLETAAIIHGATAHSLLLFDEIGRGTSTYDGMAIARAVVEFIHNRPDVSAKTIFATHYHELIDLAESFPRVHNFNVAVAEERGEVVFLHQILPGGATRSYGIHVAKLAGIPSPIIQRAHDLLEHLEREGLDQGASAHNELSAANTKESQDYLEELILSLDIDSLTPLDALKKLYEVQKHIRDYRS